MFGVFRFIGEPALVIEEIFYLFGSVRIR